MDKFNNQFATQKLRQEMSVTGTGASFTPGTGEQMATNKAFKKKTKKEMKDVEPKLAAGKAKVYPKEKWGWKDAPSIPNRSSKGGFIYKQLFEELSDFISETNIPENIKKFAKKKGASRIVNTIANWAEKAGKKIVGGTAIGKNYDTLVLDLTHQGSEIYINVDTDTVEVNGKPVRNYNDFVKALETQDVNERREPLEIDDRVKVVYGNEFYGETGTITDIIRGFVTVEMDRDGKEYSMHSSDVEKIEDEEDDDDMFEEIKHEDKVKIVDDENKYFGRTGKVHDIHDDNTAMIIVDAPGNPTTTVDIAKLKPISGINESYSKFKTETKTRGKSDQFHQAVREVRKKVQEINRLFEYVSRLKSELSEGEGGLKYKIHTEKALQKIKEMVSALNQNVKKFK